MTDVWSTLLRLGVALVVVLPLAYVAARLYSKQTIGRVGRALHVLDVRALGPNRGIYLVEVGDRILVLGVTAHHVNVLAELTDPDVIERVKEDAKGGDGAPFSHLLGDAISQLRKGRREDHSK